MQITVIISSYNEGKTIRDVLHSIYESSLFDEIIVVNDGSTEGLKHPSKFDKTNQSRAITEFMFEGL